MNTTSSIPAVGVQKKTNSSVKHIYAGFLGGLASSATLQPLELLKTRVQQSKNNSVFETLKGIHGIKGLWRGTVPSVLRTSIGASMYFTTLNVVRQRLAGPLQAAGSTSSSSLPKLSMQLNLISGMVVRSLVGFVTMPITVVKVRYESSYFHYTSMWDAVKSIHQAHGIPGFFYGFGVTVFRDAPYAGLYVLFYEQTKEILNSLVPLSSRKKKFSYEAVSINSCSAVCAATLATTITGPFDIVKTRVQLEPEKYKGFWSSCGKIIRQDGFLSLFDGLTLRLTRKALSGMISWCIYEELVKRWQTSS